MDFIKPKHRTEANLQAEFYCQCRAADIKIYLEYSYQKCRFDIVIPEDDELEVLAIIEVKRKGTTLASMRDQLWRYRQFGVHIYILDDEKDIPKILKKIQGLRKKRLKNIANPPIGLIEDKRLFDLWEILEQIHKLTE